MTTASTMLSLPTILWSGIVAAFISLAGVVYANWATNRASLERLKEQLRHDANEKHRDRLASVRKDVYLKLLADITKASGHLGALAAKDPTDGQFAEPLEVAIAELSKVQMVGSRETAAFAAELTALLGEAMLRLVGAAKPMYDDKIEIRLADQAYQENLDQSKRVLEEINSERESGEAKSARVSQLQLSYDFFSKQCKIESDRRNAAWVRYKSRHSQFAKRVLEESHKLGRARIGLTFALRKELGLDTDSSELERREREHIERADAAFKDVIRIYEDSQND